MAAVLDAGGLADCLNGLYHGKGGDELLDLYAEIRREKYLKFIDERSQRNFNRVRNQDPDHVLENDKFLKILQGLEGDAEATKAFLLVSPDAPPRIPCDEVAKLVQQKNSSIEYDFTQHYTA